MLPINPRDLQRQLKQLKRLGLKMDTIAGASRVIIELEDKDIVLDSPQIMVLEMAGQKVFYIVPSGIREEPRQRIAEVSLEKPIVTVEVSEEDARFIAEYTGVSIEEAKQALKESGGDIAKAIEIIQQRKG
ncbi:MAG TPA: NagC family transcriptional regulator [Ignisphaera aggregans]|uniref:Nascent polypeptide-associated complex protein n=1 Tax=Ignisphaera aggregans TaxID=334771 RepID=A0A832YX21_9CREN|nr:NagC family transcriptional regulator [Ignisphaera aggregans]